MVQGSRSVSTVKPPADSAEPTAVVDLEGIRVDYGKVSALKGVTLRIPVGATGLVGRNGAGKSTLLRLLLGLVRPAEGTGRVLDTPLDAAGFRLRRALGFMPENDSLMVGLRGIEQVSLAGELCGLTGKRALRRAHEVLSYVGLGEAVHRPVEQYSTGMKQRLKLAVALVHDPALLLLDEPTVGLDPPGRERMLDLLRDLTHRHGKSILLSTHILGDIADTCKTVVMIEAGQVLVAGPIDSVLAGEMPRFLLAWEGPREPFLTAIADAGGTIETNGDSPSRPPNGRIEEVQVAMPADFACQRFFELARQVGIRLRIMEPHREELADLYRRLLRQEQLHVD